MNFQRNGGQKVPLITLQAAEKFGDTGTGNRFIAEDHARNARMEKMFTSLLTICF